MCDEFGQVNKGVTVRSVRDLILDLDAGTPDDDDLLLFIDVTPAVARVVRGTCADQGTDGSVITVGGAEEATVYSGGTGTSAINHGADAAGFAAEFPVWLTNGDNLSLIPATSVVDNEDGTFDITFIAGSAANAIICETDDPNLTFEEITAGSDAIYALKNTTAAGLAVGMPYDLACQVIGQPDADAVILRFVAVRPFTLLDEGHQGTANIAADAEADFYLLVNGVQVGQLRFAASGTTITVLGMADPVDVVIGDVITLVAPPIVDATLADLAFTLVCVLA